MKRPKTDPKTRLERAITYWLEHDPIPTLDNIKRVAKSYGAAWRDLETAIKLKSELETKKKTR